MGAVSAVPLCRATASGASGVSDAAMGAASRYRLDTGDRRGAYPGNFASLEFAGSAAIGGLVPRVGGHGAGIKVGKLGDLFAPAPSGMEPPILFSIWIRGIFAAGRAQFARVGGCAGGGVVPKRRGSA